MPFRIEHRDHRDAKIRSSDRPWKESFMVFECDRHPEVKAVFEGANMAEVYKKALDAGWHKTIFNPTVNEKGMAVFTPPIVLGPCCSGRK
jgi:hypothetical protein